MKRFALVFNLLLLTQLHAQERFFHPSDSLNTKRVVSVTSTLGVSATGGMVGLWNIWYKNGESGTWKFVDDSKSWLQMDKVGHSYTAYKINQTCSDLYNWSGVSEVKSRWIGFGYAMGFQTTLEIFDGFSSDWGFSWSDMGFNSLGSGLYVGQQYLWGEERIIPKFSSTPSVYAELRPEVLGSTYTESVLKDYNGQTYWLSFSPGTFGTNSFPKWLCFSLGYSVDQKIQGDSETYTDLASGISYQSTRELAFSMDIDFSRIPVRKPWLRVLLKQLNYLKVPFPTLVLDNSGLKARPFYF